MTKLFQTIATEVPKCHGWCSVSRASALASAVIALRPEISIEVGVWGGRGTFAMALAHKEVGKGRVIAVDPWSRAASKQGQTGADAVWWGETADHELVYQDFLKRSRDLCVAHLISVQRMMSDYFNPPESFGLLSLDGNHGPQVEKDVERFCPRIALGGLVFADDVDWTGGHVRKSVERMKHMGFIELYRMETAMIMQRIKA